MYNCLQKIKAYFSQKLLAFTTVFMMMCGIAQAATYTWTGGTTGTNGKEYWAEPDNWSSSDGGTSYPGENDIVYIGKNAEIFLDDSGAKAKGLSLANNGQSSSFEVKITGTGTLEVGNHDFGGGDVGIISVRPSVAGTPTSETSKLIFDCTVNAKSLVMHSGGNVTIKKDTNVSIDSINNIGAGSDPSTLLRVDGNLVSNSIALSNVSTRTITVSESGSLNSGTLTGSNGSVTNNGIVFVSSNIDSNLVNGVSTGSTTATAASNVWTWNPNEWSNQTSWRNEENWIPRSVPNGTDAIVIINGGKDYYPEITYEDIDEADVLNSIHQVNYNLFII